MLEGTRRSKHAGERVREGARGGPPPVGSSCWRLVVRCLCAAQFFFDFFCASGKNVPQGRKKYQISRLPKYLVLHMKRFTRVRGEVGIPRSCSGAAAETHLRPLAARENPASLRDVQANVLRGAPWRHVQSVLLLSRASCCTFARL